MKEDNTNHSKFFIKYFNKQQPFQALASIFPFSDSFYEELDKESSLAPYLVNFADSLLFSSVLDACAANVFIIEYLIEKVTFDATIEIFF